MSAAIQMDKGEPRAASQIQGCTLIGSGSRSLPLVHFHEDGGVSLLDLLITDRSIPKRMMVRHLIQRDFPRAFRTWRVAKKHRAKMLPAVALAVLAVARRR